MHLIKAARRSYVDIPGAHTVDDRPSGVVLGDLPQKLDRLLPVEDSPARRETLLGAVVAPVLPLRSAAGAGEVEVRRRLPWFVVADDVHRAVFELDDGGAATWVGDQVVDRRAAVEVDIVLLQQSDRLLGRSRVVEH